jgi:hypothetical protein
LLVADAQTDLGEQAFDADFVDDAAELIPPA